MTLCSRLAALVVVIAASLISVRADITVDSTAGLVSAVRDGAEGTTIELAAGAYELEAPLELKAGMMLKGAGIDATIITHTPRWRPSTKSLPDPEMKLEGLDTDHRTFMPSLGIAVPTFHRGKLSAVRSSFACPWFPASRS